MSATTTADRGGGAGSSDPLGSIGWTERTGGVLTARECVTLARPLLRRARHPGRPVGDGPARAFGTPRHHRTGAPCAPGLVAGPRRAGGRRGPPHTGAAQPRPSLLRLGSCHRRTTRDLV